MQNRITILLCDQHELHQTYPCSSKERFDDSLPFWPLVHDAPSLPMAVAHALRDLAHLNAAQPATALAQQVHLSADMHRALESHVGDGLT
jgi:hypothetical protein